MSMSMSMINWNGRNAIISSYWVCLFTKFRWRLHRALRLAWITWIPFILWFSMIFKIGLNIVHGFMNATFIDDSLCQWSLTINVHSCIYEHWSCMINDHRNNYEHWSSMIIDIDYDSWRSMIVAMKCCWSYMISVDHCIISWTLQSDKTTSSYYLHASIYARCVVWAVQWILCSLGWLQTNQI